MPGYNPGVTSRISGFVWSWVGLQTADLLKLKGTCLQVEKESLPRVNSVHWINFKLDLKVKTRLTRDKPGASTLRFERGADMVLWSATSAKGMEISVVIDVLETTEVHENGDVGIKASPPQ